MSERDERDPFASIEASPRFAHPLAALAVLLGVVAAVNAFMIAGPVGMAVGLVSHVKGSRFGMPSAAFAAVGMVVGMSLTFLLR